MVGKPYFVLPKFNTHTNKKVPTLMGRHLQRVLAASYIFISAL